MTTAQSPLDYALPSKALARRRTRRIIFLTIFAVVVGLGVWRGKFAFERVKFLYWQHRCETYSPAGDHVAWDEDPVRVPGLLAGKGEYRPFRPRDSRGYAIAAHIPREFEQFRPYTFLARSPALHGLLFMHELTSPAGSRRIVIIREKMQRCDPKFITGFDVQVEIFQPGTWTKPPVECSGPVVIDVLWSTSTSTVRLFSGQVDPADQSHFTIAYEVNGRPAMVDGYLRDAGADNRIDFVRRTGVNEGKKP